MRLPFFPLAVIGLLAGFLGMTANCHCDMNGEVEAETDTTDDDEDDYSCGDDAGCREVNTSCEIGCLIQSDYDPGCLDDCKRDFAVCLSDGGCIQPSLICADDCLHAYSDETDEYWTCAAECDEDEAKCLDKYCPLAEGDCYYSCFLYDRVCRHDADGERLALLECVYSRASCTQRCTLMLR